MKAYAPEFSIISIFISTGKGNGASPTPQEKKCVECWLVGFWTVTNGDKKVKGGIEKGDTTGCHFLSACITFEMAQKSKLIACI